MSYTGESRLQFLIDDVVWAVSITLMPSGVLMLTIDQGPVPRIAVEIADGRSDEEFGLVEALGMPPILTQGERGAKLPETLAEFVEDLRREQIREELQVPKIIYVP